MTVEVLMLSYPFFVQHLSIETRSNLVSDDQRLNLLIMSELSKSLVILYCVQGVHVLMIQKNVYI